MKIVPILFFGALVSGCVRLPALECDITVIEHRDYWGPGPDDFDIVTFEIEDCY